MSPMKRLVAVVACILVSVATAGAELRWMDVERSTVTVTVFASGAADAAHVIDAPLAEGSVEDTETPHMALVINVDQLRVVDPGQSAEERQKVLAQMLGPEGLEAERYARVTYHSLTIEQPGAGVWLVRGELGMHGRFLPLDARAVRRGDRFTGTATVVPADFGIPPLRIGGDSAPVGHELRVDFDIVLEAR